MSARSIDAPALQAAYKTLQFGDDVTVQVHFSTSQCFVASSGYPGYPVTSHDVDGAKVVLEGRVYSSWNEREILVELYSIVAGQTEIDEQRLADWISRIGGDFLVTFVWPDRLIVVNDALGRLPAYVYTDAHSVIIAREPKFIGALVRPPMSRRHCAEYLTFGYCLGTGTPYEGIERMCGGAVIDVRKFDNGVFARHRAVLSLNFDEKEDCPNVERRGEELADLFRTATQEMCRGVNNIVISLSGGQDSRAVAAALQGDPRVRAATFCCESGYGLNDARLAERIARTLGLQWTLTRLSGNTLEQERRLIRLKDGLNYTAMGFILPFMDRIVETYGRTALYVTGDGGDKLMPDLSPPKSVHDLSQLSWYLLRKHSVCPAELTTKIFGVPNSTLIDAIVNALEAYPETTTVGKAAHFTIYERARKYLFEGEDRSRFFLWEIAPFYSLRFAVKAMRTPDRLKTDYRLYRTFQRSLSPATANIPDANLGFASTDWRFALMLYALRQYQQLPAPVRTLIRSLLGNQNTPLSEAFEGRCKFTVWLPRFIGGSLQFHLRSLALAEENWNSICWSSAIVCRVGTTQVL